MRITKKDLETLKSINSTIKNDELKAIIDKLEKQRKKDNLIVKNKMKEKRKNDKNYGGNAYNEWRKNYMKEYYKKQKQYFKN